MLVSGLVLTTDKFVKVIVDYSKMLTRCEKYRGPYRGRATMWHALQKKKSRPWMKRESLCTSGVVGNKTNHIGYIK